MKCPLPNLLRATALAVGLLGLPVAAMAQDAADGDGIVVYNAQHESLTQAWADGFTKETGIKVTLRNGSDTELGNQLVQEGAASPADVFLTENSPAMVLVDSAGLFAPLDCRHPRAGAGELPAGRTATGSASRPARPSLPTTRRKLDADTAAEIADGPRRSGLEGPLGRLARRAPISRPSSARCSRSRARQRPRPGSRP